MIGKCLCKCRPRNSTLPFLPTIGLPTKSFRTRTVKSNLGVWRQMKGKMIDNEVKGTKRPSLLPSWGCLDHVQVPSEWGDLKYSCENTQTSQNETVRQVTPIHQGHTGEDGNHWFTVVCMSLLIKDSEGHLMKKGFSKHQEVVKQHITQKTDMVPDFQGLGSKEHRTAMYLFYVFSFPFHFWGLAPGKYCIPVD